MGKKKKPARRKKPAKQIKQPQPAPAPQSITIVNQSALAPELVENKFTLPKTWLGDKQIMRMVQQTPPEHIYTRPAKGGGTWSYVTGTYVQKVLNYVFGWLWDFEIVSEQEKYGSVIVLGKLTVKDGKGNSITKMQFGRAEVKHRKNSKEALDYGNDLKAAATDALKKCASELGIASDIYGKNEFKDVGKQVVGPTIAQSAAAFKPAAPLKPAPHLECHECAAIITQAEHNFSLARFHKPLCHVCQNQYGNAKIRTNK